MLTDEAEEKGVCLPDDLQGHRGGKNHPIAGVEKESVPGPYWRRGQHFGPPGQMPCLNERTGEEINLSYACGSKGRAVSRDRPSTAPFVYSLGF